MEQNRELRKKLRLENEEKKQRREFLKAAGGDDVTPGGKQLQWTSYLGSAVAT